MIAVRTLTEPAHGLQHVPDIQLRQGLLQAGRRLLVSELRQQVRHGSAGVAGGCNPVPIFPEDRVTDGTNIIIPREYLAQAKALFASWKY